MNKDLLTNAFMAHKIFTFFWNDALLDCLTDEIKLDLSPQLYINTFQKIIDLPLDNLKKSDELSDMNAKIQMTLTSLKDAPFDVGQAIKDIDLDSAKDAIMVVVEIKDGDKSVFKTQFNLGSKEDEKIEVASRYMERFSCLYSDSK